MSKTGPSKEEVDRAAELEKIFDAMNDVTGDIAKNLQTIKEEEAAILSATDKTVKLNQLQRQLKKESARLEKNELGLSEKQLDVQIKKLAKARVQLEASKQMAKENLRIRNQFVGINDQAQKLSKNIQNFVEALPGGGTLVKMLGIDTIGEKLEEGLNQAAEVMRSGGSMKDAMDAFGGGIKGILGPVGKLVVIIGGLVALFTKINKEAKELSKATGLTVGQSMLLAKEARAITSDLGTQLSTSEDILAVQKATLPVFSNINALSTEQAATISEIGLAFGYGAEQAAKVNNAFMLMGVSAEEAANQQRNLSAEALKAGVNVGTVVADIAESSKEVAKFFGGNVEELKKAAIQAAKLGMSIKDMAKVSDGLLNFEESISAQFELQALTGSQINLDLARQKALQGDIAGATKEVLSQVGGIAEFNEMDVIQRQALAKATGLSVDELQKSLIIQEKLGDLGPEQVAAMSKLGLSAAEMAGMTDKQLQNRLAQQQATDKTAQSFKAMGDILMNALQPAAEAVGAIFGALAPVLKIAFAPIEYAAKALGFLLELAKEYYGVTIAIGSVLALNYAKNKLDAGLQTKKGIEQKAQLLVEQFKNSQLGIALGLNQANVVAEQAANAEKKKGILLQTRSILKGALDGAVRLGGAIASAFTALAALGPIGIGLGIAAAATISALVYKAMQPKSVGDLGIDPGGGPIVMSPQVGGVFQGDRRDGVSMGPGMGTNPSVGGGGGGSVVIDYQRMAQIFISALQGVKLQPAPVQIGSQVINEIGTQIDVNKSYK